MILSDDASAIKLLPPLLKKFALEIEGGTGMKMGKVRISPTAVAFLMGGQGTAARISGARQPIASFIYVLLSEDPQVAKDAAERATKLV